jgi:AraC-like DNA-binding protein
MMTAQLETTDVETARQVLSRLYPIRHIAASGDRPFLRLRKNRFGPLELHHITLTMTCDVLLDPPGRLYLGHVIDGAVTYDQLGERRTWKAGDTFLASQPDLASHAEVHEADLEFLIIETALLARVADTDPARSAEPIRFTGYQPANPQAAVQWRDTFTYVRDTVGNLPAATTPLLLGSIARLLAATALATFPNTALLDPVVGDRRGGHPASVRRAVAFIEENAHRDVSSADIAVAADVNLRTLQVAFRRHLDCTPRAYLRRVRLDRVHGDLRTADPDRTTVMAVASRWGFVNHSRFTAFYRETYGITPSHTLRYV